MFSLCMCILNSSAIRSACGYRQEVDRTFLRPLTAALIMGIFTYLAHLLLDITIGGRFIPVAGAIVIAVIVYAFAALKLGVFTGQDIKDLPQGKKIYRICRKYHLLPR